jgi:hypothetical protein
MKLSKLFAVVLAGCAMNAPYAIAQPQQTNIALGKSVTFSAPPNYSLSNDEDDIRQLTDGKYVSLGPLQEVENTRAIWVQKGTVGWSKVMPLVITIDLGSVQPISGVSYSTAAGISDVQWPTAIYLSVSDDNKTWRAAGDLMQLSRKNGAPPVGKGYANFRFTTRDLQTKGRYLALSVVQQPYAFVDEIEVYKGDETWLNRPLTTPVFTDVKERTKTALIATLATNRVQSDADAVRAAIAASGLSAAQRSTLAARLDDALQTPLFPETLPLDFKTILPLDEMHRKVLAVHGELLKAQGFAPLTVWKTHRYAWLPLVAKPARGAKPQLSISMLKNQFRSDALLLTNAGSTPITATVQLKNAPRGAQTGWLQLLATQWTDTRESLPVADALLPLDAQNGIYRVTIPAGMTRKLWLTVDSSKVPAGDYRSTLEVSSGAQTTIVPLALNVSARAMKAPRLATFFWDYLNGGSGMPAITEKNQAALQKVMRSHFVNTIWSTNIVLPRPSAADFDADGNLKNPLDFTKFDEWIAMWPDARAYYVYAAVNYDFAGAKMGTPEFNARVASWAKVLSAHMKELGKKPQQLGLLLVDEPFTDERDARVVGWAEPIAAAAPELTLFSDPIWERPDQTKTPAAITLMDVLCFHIPVYYQGGEPVRDFVQKLRADGKTIWLYQATGPIRAYDPQLSYRQLAWHSFSIGGSGVGSWALADTGGAPTSWTEYSLSHTSYAPIFVGETSANTSLHWEAMREGAQDFEELAMLQDAIQSSKDAAWKKQAQQVLSDAVQSVTANWDAKRAWTSERDPNLTDAALQKVRALLGR